jgi:transcriptional regulator with XRE-family HTH domain
VPNESPKQLFGKRLREIRETKNISQEKLAEFAGGHRNTIGNLERGQGNPTFDYIMKVAQALKIKPSILFELIPKQ